MVIGDSGSRTSQFQPSGAPEALTFDDSCHLVTTRSGTDNLYANIDNVVNGAASQFYFNTLPDIQVHSSIIICTCRFVPAVQQDTPGTQDLSCYCGPNVGLAFLTTSADGFVTVDNVYTPDQTVGLRINLVNGGPTR